MWFIVVQEFNPPPKISWFYDDSESFQCDSAQPIWFNKCPCVRVVQKKKKEALLSVHLDIYR